MATDETRSLILATIGVYGTTRDSFFAALRAFGATHFVDVRRRRGLRGHDYAYANATALQAELSSLGVAYVHELGLAASHEARSTQLAADKATATGQRSRSSLSPEFAARYRRECLEGFDAAEFLAQFPPGARIVLFCVERSPEACHRSLAAGPSPHTAASPGATSRLDRTPSRTVAAG